MLPRGPFGSTTLHIIYYAMLNTKPTIGLLIFICCIQVAHAKKLPLWEFGLGIGGISIPDYRGSDNSQDYLLPLPYFRYRGDLVKVDRDGGHLDIFENKSLELDISFNAAPPVNSDDNEARRGMPDLDPTIEIGPELNILLTENLGNPIRWKIVLPVRAVIATDFSHTQQIGWTFAPHLHFKYDFNWRFSLSLGPVYATEKYHDYYYQVDPAFATADRPAFDAKGGYSGARLTATISKRFSKYWIGAFARYDSLSGAAFEDSPLVKKRGSLMIGVGIAWFIGESKITVQAER